MKHGMLPAVQLVPNQVIVTGPASQIVLPEGSPLRQAACLICRKPIGSQTADLIALCLTGIPPAASGNVGGVAFLIHGDCPLPDATALIRLAYRRITDDQESSELSGWRP